MIEPRQTPTAPPTRKLLWKGASRLILVMTALVLLVIVVASQLLSRHEAELGRADRENTRAEVQAPADFGGLALSC